MASGDVVFEADNFGVIQHLEGKGAGIPDINSQDLGYRVRFGGGMIPTGEALMYLITSDVTPSSSPFDPTKTYDVVIKEH